MYLNIKVHKADKATGQSSSDKLQHELRTAIAKEPRCGSVSMQGCLLFLVEAFSHRIPEASEHVGI